MVLEVVREVWKLFVRRLWRTLVIVALMLAPLELLVLAFDRDFDWVAPGWWAWVALTSVVTLVAFPWVIGAVVHDVADDDRVPAKAYARTFSHLPDLTLSALVTTVGIVLGTIALVVPGLILVARWALVVPLIVLEGARWRVALSRSNQLVRGRTKSVLAIFFLLTVIGLALVAIPLVVGYSVVGGVLGAWLATLAVDTVFIAFYSFAPFVLHRRLTT
jgi:uncharacterized membrane protein